MLTQDTVLAWRQYQAASLEVQQGVNAVSHLARATRWHEPLQGYTHLILAQKQLRQYPVACLLSGYEAYATQNNLKELTFHIDPSYLAALQRTLVEMESLNALPSVAPSDYSLSLCLLLSGLLAGSLTDDRLISQLLTQTTAVVGWYDRARNAPDIGSISSRNGRFNANAYMISNASTCSGIVLAHDRIVVPLLISGKACISSEPLIRNIMKQVGVNTLYASTVDWIWNLFPRPDAPDAHDDRGHYRKVLDRLVATIGSHAVLLTHFVVRTLLRYLVGPSAQTWPGPMQATLLSLVDVVRDEELPLFGKPMPITTKRAFRVLLSRIRFYSQRFRASKRREHHEHHHDAIRDDTSNFDAPALYPPRSTFLAMCDFHREHARAPIVSVPSCVLSDSPLVHMALPCFPPIFHLLPLPLHIRRHTTTEHVLNIVEKQCTVFQLVHFDKEALNMNAQPNTVAHVLAMLLRSLRALVLLRAPHRKRDLLQSFDCLFPPLWAYMSTHAASRVPFVFPVVALDDRGPAKAWEVVHHAIVDARRAEHHAQEVEKATVRDEVLREMQRELRDHSASVVCGASECTGDMTVGQCLNAQVSAAKDDAARVDVLEKMRARVDQQQTCTREAALASAAQLDATMQLHVKRAVDQVHANASNPTEDVHVQLQNRWNAFFATCTPPVGTSIEAWPILRAAGAPEMAVDCVLCLNAFVVRAEKNTFRCHLRHVRRSPNAAAAYSKHANGDVCAHVYSVPEEVRSDGAEHTLHDEVQTLVAEWWKRCRCRDPRARPRITGLQSFLNIVQADITVTVGTHYSERAGSVHDPSVAMGTDECDVLFVGPYRPGKQIRYAPDWVTMSDENVTLVP
jgi:hypothetical protein